MARFIVAVVIYKLQVADVGVAGYFMPKIAAFAGLTIVQTWYYILAFAVLPNDTQRDHVDVKRA